MGVALGRSGLPPDYGTPQTVTLSSGVITVSGPGQITVCAEVGVTGNLTKILGLTVKGQKVSLRADAGDTIMAKNGANLRLGRIDFPLTGNNKLVLEYDGSDVCSELSRSPNS